MWTDSNRILSLHPKQIKYYITNMSLTDNLLYKCVSSMNGPGDYPLPHPLLASVMHFIPLQVHYQLQTRGYIVPWPQRPEA